MQYRVLGRLSAFGLSMVFLMALTPQQAVLAGGSSNCCEANGGAGCDCPECEQLVCGAYPNCCDSWTAICVIWAELFCGDLCNGGPACGDEICDCGEALDCPSDCATRVPSDPPNNAIDARQPFAPDGSDPAGWDTIDPYLHGPTEGMTPADFSISQDPPGRHPTIIGVETEGNTATLYFSGAISLLAWTTITHDASGASTRIGSLPADVSNDGTSSATDVLVLIDHLNGVISLAEYQTDIDRTGQTNANDVLRVIDLLNGAGVYDEWLGATLPD